MLLKDLKIGEAAIVENVGGEGALRQHFLDMGMIPGTQLTLMKFAPMGDPMELQIHGYSLTLRLADAEKIEVKKIDSQGTTENFNNHVSLKEEFPYFESLHDHNAHPGFGEEGKFHSKKDENPLPKGTQLTFALVGQQNCGKTTLFNQLTGAKQHVGNFPGVTVDRKDGVIMGHPETLVTDLPGIYSLSPYTAEELVARKVIMEEKPKAIINIVDASNIERNLYLTVQLMELGIPLVLALNMMDEVRNNNGSIRVNELEKILGIPVVPISAARNEGVEELVEHAIHVAKFQELPARQDFCRKNESGGAVHRCIHSIMHLIENHAEKAKIPVRFATLKLIEGDNLILNELNLSQREKDTLEHIIEQMEEERGLDRSAAIADMRYAFIQNLCEQTVVKPKQSKEFIRSRKIDTVLTGKWSAIPIFLAIISLIIYLSIELLGAPLQDLLENGITYLANLTDRAMERNDVSVTVRSLVVDGIFGGVGSVLSFLPLIIILFFFLSLLEDSGYMARIAFVMDKPLRKLGLSGHSIVPLLIGFGCSVPAIMATRTLSSTNDRKRTIMLTPFMSCSAKIPIYVFFAGTFFPNYAGWVVVILYLLGVIIGLITALITKKLYRRKEASPFVMELPNYRLPQVKNVGHLLWDKTMDFVKRAFTIIFVASVVIWTLQTFDFQFHVASDSAESMLARIGGALAPIFAPMQLGEWQIVTALVTGFIAKEMVVSTLGVLGVMSVITPLTAIPMLVFCLLYTPCVAAIASVNRELGAKWAFFVVVLQCVVAWICAYLSYLLAAIFI